MIPKLIDERIEKKLRGIYTACTAIVTQAKGDKCNIKLEDGEDTELFDVPVAKNLQLLHHHEPAAIVVSDTDDGSTVNTWVVAGPPVSDAIKEGDRVLVVFSKYPLAGRSARRFDINDAIVVAKL